MIRSERGSATIWMLGVAALVAVVALSAVVGASAVLGRHRLERAADLAALAAATEIGGGGDPCLTAARVAAANGARLTACSCSLDGSGRSGNVGVEVSRRLTLPVVGARELTARARAGRLPAAPN